MLRYEVHYLGAVLSLTILWRSTLQSYKFTIPYMGKVFTSTNLCRTFSYFQVTDFKSSP